MTQGISKKSEQKVNDHGHQVNCLAVKNNVFAARAAACRPLEHGSAVLARQGGKTNILVDKMMALLYLVFIDFSWISFFLERAKNALMR